MTKKLLTGSALAAMLAGGACTVHQTETPAVSGPSTFARSVTMTVSPDRITQDGASQSSVSASVNGPDGRPLGGISVRMDMLVAGQTSDYGTLSARTVVTGSDGIARVVYTAPPASPPPADSTIKTVSIRAIVIGIDAQSAGSSVSADIRLVPAGVILPPADTPTASFTMSPTAALASVPVTFDGSASKPGAGASSISSYSWNFGDGTVAASGKSVTHTFTSQATFNVTLTVTNDRGLSASTTVATAVGGLVLPLPKFVFSPAAPVAGQAVVFNADQSTAAPGHTVTTFNWNFGDGGTGTGFLVSHTFTLPATYNVVLAILDDIGQKATLSSSVPVILAPGGVAGAPNADFTFSPIAPAVGEQVVFDSSKSSAAPGRTLVDYAWNFGDNTPIINGNNRIIAHTYDRTGTFVVNVVITDSAGATGQRTSTVPVGSGNPTAVLALFKTGGNSIQADGSGSTATGGSSIVNYRFIWGDGTPDTLGATSSVPHTYAAPGAHTVTLIVTDNASPTPRTASTSKDLTTP